MNIQNLFPIGINPFVGGFGNRENDAVAYKYMNIPIDHIFIINKKTEIIQLTNKHKTR
jgi:phosphatidate phosphatase PAH1